MFPMIRAALALLISCVFTVTAWTTELYKTDVTQRAMPEQGTLPDHLEPFQANVPQDYYLAQFIEAPALVVEGNYLVVLRTKEGKCLMRTNKVPTEKLLLKPEKFEIEIQIPESLASVIYDMWVNALFEVRYDRSAGMGLDGTTYIFSTFVMGLGWMHGSTWSPSADLPPSWMVEAGNRLIGFARDPKRDVKATEADLKALRSKLFSYIKAHGKH